MEAGIKKINLESGIGILQKLKGSTQLQHEKIEENTLTKGIMENTISKEDYLYLISRFYGFHKACENGLKQTTLWIQEGFDIERRLKSSFLEKDLLFLGVNKSEIPNVELCDNIPNLGNDAQRIGFLYVMEGSTLGGQVLGRQLFRRFGYETEKGASYFNSYGVNNLKVMWEEFQKLVVKYNQNNIQHESEMIQSAMDTFEKLDNWLSK